MVGAALMFLCAVGGAASLRSMLTIDDRHALAGLFGEPAREHALSSQATSLLHDAEAWLRVVAFSDVLTGMAWNGVPLSVCRRPGGWSEWQFADGSAWLVRHSDRPPRLLRRLIVAGTTETRDGVEVDAYGAGGGARGAVLHVVDAEHRPSSIACRR